MKIVRKFIYILFIFCILISNLYIPKIEAKTLGDLKQELAKFEEDYRKNQLQQELTESEMEQIKININQINDKIVSLGVDIDNLNEEIEKLNEDIISKEAEIESILAFVQISNGESAYLEYAFGAQNFTDFIYRIAVSEQLTTYNDNLVDEYKQNIEDNKLKQEELSLKRVNLTEEQANLKVELDKAKASLQELDSLSLSIEEEIEARKSEIKIYEDKGCKDNEDIATCGRAVLPPDTSFYRPLKIGYLTGWYGKRDCSDPRLTCFHNGLDMSSYNANTGNVPVYSVANGMVVYITGPTYNSKTGRYNNNCGGRKIYIQHNVNGKIYTSGYLHLRRIDVEVGQIVTKDTQIGIMGGYRANGYEYWDTCTTGSHLHLEISTGNFNAGTYYSYRSTATNYVNFPKTLYKDWYDRITKF